MKIFAPLALLCALVGCNSAHVSSFSVSAHPTIRSHAADSPSTHPGDRGVHVADSPGIILF